MTNQDGEKSKTNNPHVAGVAQKKSEQPDVAKPVGEQGVSTPADKSKGKEASDKPEFQRGVAE